MVLDFQELEVVLDFWEVELVLDLGALAEGPSAQVVVFGWVAVAADTSAAVAFADAEQQSARAPQRNGARRTPLSAPSAPPRKLAEQLRQSEERVSRLQSDLKQSQERAQRAENWLNKHPKGNRGNLLYTCNDRAATLISAATCDASIAESACSIFSRLRGLSRLRLILSGLLWCSRPHSRSILRATNRGEDLFSATEFVGGLRFSDSGC